MKIASFEDYLKLMKSSKLKVFVFVLDDELSYLNYDSCWIHHLRCDAHIVRLQEHEFNTMDIAVHPKTFITRKGRELKEMNGIPQIHILKKTIENYL